MMIDGYDLYLVRWILPALSDSFHVQPCRAHAGASDPAGAAMFLSAVFVGPLLGDRFGRRNLVIACLIGTGALSPWVAAFSVNPTEFTIWRVLTGLCAAADRAGASHTVVGRLPRAACGATFSTIVVCGAMERLVDRRGHAGLHPAALGLDRGHVPGRRVYRLS